MKSHFHSLRNEERKMWIHPASNIRQDSHVRWPVDMSCKGFGAKLMRLCLMRYGNDANGLVIKWSLMRVSVAKSDTYQSILVVLSTILLIS